MEGERFRQAACLRELTLGLGIERPVRLAGLGLRYSASYTDGGLEIPIARGLGHVHDASPPRATCVNDPLAPNKLVMKTTASNGH